MLTIPGWNPRKLNTNASRYTFRFSAERHPFEPAGAQRHLACQHGSVSLIMDRAYEGNETRQLALALGYEPVVSCLT